MASKKIKEAAAAAAVDDRSRNWATIIYPESCPDYMEKIGGMVITGFLSPLHSDPGEDEKTERKPHFHLLVKFSSVKSQDQVLSIFQAAGFVGAERISDFRSYARYLCHLDQPLKKKYDIDQVVSFGGLDYREIIQASADKYKIISEMIQFCEQEPELIKDSFANLTKYAIDQGKIDWFRALCDNAAYIMTSYLQSLHWTRRAYGDPSGK